MNRTFQRTCSIAIGTIGLALGVMAPASADTQQQCGLLGCLLSTGTKTVQQVVGGVTGALTPHPAQPRTSQPQPAPAQPSSPAQSSGSPGSSHPGGQTAPQAPAAAGPAEPAQTTPQDSVPGSAASPATIRIGQYPPVSTESRAAQPSGAAPGTGVRHPAGTGQTKQAGQPTLARIATNAVNRDLPVELVVLFMVGGAGTILYRSHRNAAQAPRYVGRRRYNGPRPQGVRPVA